MSRPRRSTAASVADWDDMERDYRNSAHENPDDPDGAGVEFDHKRLYICKISSELTVKGLARMCAQYGTVVQSYISTDSSKRYAMVTFQTPGEARLAMTSLQDAPPFYMKISFAKATKNSKPQLAAERSCSRSSAPPEPPEPRGRWDDASSSSGHLDMGDDGDFLLSADKVNLDELDDEELQAMMYEMKIQRLLKQRERTRQSRGAAMSGERVMVDHRVTVRNTAAGVPDAARCDGSADEHAATPTEVQVRQCLFCSSPSSLVCGRCHMAPYCSARCQQRDWAQRHGKVCHNLATQAKTCTETPSTAGLLGAIPTSRAFRPEFFEAEKPLEPPVRKPIEPLMRKPIGPPSGTNGDYGPGLNVRNMGPAGRPIPYAEIGKHQENNKPARCSLNTNGSPGYRSQGAHDMNADGYNKNREGYNKQGYDRKGPNDGGKMGYNKPNNNHSGRGGCNKARKPGMRPPLRHEVNDDLEIDSADSVSVQDAATPAKSIAVEVTRTAALAAIPSVKTAPLTAKDTPEHFSPELTSAGDVVNVTECRRSGGQLTGLCVGAGHMEQYEQLFAPLEEACARGPTVLPAPGDVFCLQDPSDGGWYRARCLAAGEAALVDAARTLPLEGVACRALAPNFREIPEFSCVVDTRAEVEDGASFTATVVSNTGGVVTVSLAALDGGAAVGEARLSRWRPAVQAPAPPPAPTPKEAPAVPPVAGRPLSASLAAAPQRAPPKEEPPVAKETPEHYLPELAAPGAVLSLADVVRLGEQTLCLAMDAPHADQYQRLIEEFGEACERDTVEFTPAPGEVCAAADPADGFWYRARRLGARAALLDAPRLLPADGLRCRRLAGEYAAMPEFACVVDGPVKTDEMYQATVVSKTGGVVTVSLAALDGGAALGEARLSRWRPPLDASAPAAAPGTPAAAATPASAPATPALPEVMVPFVRPALAAGGEVLLVHAAAADDVWVRPADGAARAAYNECLQEVALYGQTAAPLSEPQPAGAVVLAEHADGCHYRALILKTKHAKNLYRIEYLELGVTETTCLEKLRQCPRELAPAQHPPLVSRLTLSDVSELSPPALQHLLRLKEDEELLTLTGAEGCASVPSGGAAVLTRVTNRERVNAKLAEMSRPEWKKMEAQGMDVLQSKILTMDHMRYVELPAGGGELLVLDASLLNQGVVSGCSQDEPNVQYVTEQLPAELARYCSSELGREPYLPRPDELCVAQFPPHEGWFRATMVEQAGGAGGRAATVVYVDYGNMGGVDVRLLRKMLPEFVERPALACLVTIKDFPADASAATVERARRLLGLSEESPYGSLKVTRCECEAASGMWLVEAPEFVAALRGGA